MKPSAGIPPGESWAFTQTGSPSGPHAGLVSLYAHGRGGWGAGRGTGTICIQDSLAGQGSKSVVLSVSGKDRVSPGVTRVGRPGVALELALTVASSDDESCPAGTHGKATLFASYYEGHHDLLGLRFAGACASHDFNFSGSQLHVAIARDGRQVDSA
ncbi:MAG TPA: hypothetical protein VGY13_12580 [Solirubrobacteraceae bacterium]|nr:hypothetical protein [Solirubrobacteraceae bacterium]